VKAEVYAAYRNRGLRALAESPPISELLFAAADHLPDATVAALREALLALDAPAILTGIKAGVERLVPVSDADYDPLRELLGAERDGGAGGRR
jgi:ABC-type phosphate/phosphonate transport system substrate-binding protein